MALNRNSFDPENILARIERVQRLAQLSSSDPTADPILETLLMGRMELQGLMPWSSNYTYLVDLSGGDQAKLLGIYKPGAGERPLWDFPEQSLSLREFASYLVSLTLGWPSIPATVLRHGPHGLGSVQLFVEAEYEAHYFNMRGMPAFVEDFRRMALFDYIINNADRKGGHCLKGTDGRIWAIDHGLTFHVKPKLRTVIWEFCDEAVPDPLLTDLARLYQLLQEAEFCQTLANLISPREIKALERRTELLVSTGQFPKTRMGRNVPFPPI
jgi:uncharacterized repeat protein (TIGR03843 family)